MPEINLNSLNISSFVSGLNDVDVTYLDFRNVAGIDFGAMRSLLRAHAAGKKFCIVNVHPAVREKLEDAGITEFISVCGEPAEIDISAFTRSGEGYLGVSYDNADGDSMLKLENPAMPDECILREKIVATRAFQLGVPTPLAGPVVKAGGQIGVIYERIAGKRSFARAVSQEPEKIEYFASRFARLARSLHEKECDTGAFPGVVHKYEEGIEKNKFFSPGEKAKYLDFVHSIPVQTTCLHGDMHFGNAITTGEKDYWIDMSEFSYGNPVFDLGKFFFGCHISPEEMTMKLFHIGNAAMKRFWDLFIRSYYEGWSEEQIAKQEKLFSRLGSLQLCLVPPPMEFDQKMKDIIDMLWR